MTKKNYTEDKPIVNSEDDRFQRAGFAKRVAVTIRNRQDNVNIVFGIYGAWGEGKSSVLNLIDKELTDEHDIVKIHFNPWRYGDEEALLQHYFDTIAKALNKSLHEWQETLGNWFSRATNGVKVYGIPVDWIGKTLSDVSLEKLKQRVNTFLQVSDKKLIIFIDDIDRLDKKEIFAIFRLVKLTADFSNTTYILSFDEKMVAAAIGEQFESGDIHAGERFLEKIIQVPLTIPKAQPAALLKFCSEQVDKAFSVNDLIFDAKQAENFNETFSSYILPALNTPRLAIRYGNALSFALPLLQGEVNIYDLLLIEAFKIFYPEYYTFIKNNPRLFTSSYFLYENTEDVDKRTELINGLKDISSAISPQYQALARNLLNELFPLVDFSDRQNDSSDIQLNFWRFHKKICSPDYFERYFTYTVLDGEVSDIAFEELLSQAEKSSVSELSKLLSELINSSNPSDVIAKLLLHEGELNWAQCRNIALSICHISELLPHDQGTLSMFYQSPRMQGAIFIAQALKTHKQEPVFETAKDLLGSAVDIHFAYMINNRMRSGETQEKLFDENQYLELAMVFRDCALREAQQANVSLFELFNRYPDRLNYVLATWRINDRVGLRSYVDKYLDQDPSHIIVFLRAVIPMGSNGSGAEYKTDFNKQLYDFVVDIAGAEELITKLFRVYPEEILRIGRSHLIEYHDDWFSDMNMAQQFVELYDEAHTLTVNNNQKK